MTVSSDDEPDFGGQSTRPSNATSHFDFDDAFSETDETDASFEFSPAAIRQEFAKHMHAVRPWNPEHDLEFTGVIPYSADPDASVSTFDIDAQDEPISPPTQQPPSQPDSNDDDNLPDSFSQVSLSTHPSPSEHHSDRNGDFKDYPSVQIEVSENHTVPAEVKLHDPSLPEGTVEHVGSSLSPVEALEELTSPPPTTPQTSASVASASSLSIPVSYSLPSPSTANSAASNASFSSRHRSTRSMGPSVLDKVVSKTRPHFLPPKDRTEDQKHMADWEAMMKRSRVAEEKRRKALQERRFARERKIEESIATWEREIVPNWRVVFKDPSLRRLWWSGIPTKLRASMWEHAVGNPLALSKDSFKACLSRANRALASGSFPTTVLGLIDDDIKGTLPSLHLFMPPTGPLYQDLKDMLCAWVVSRSDEGLGYVPGVAKIAAMVLLNMAPAQGFVVMRNLLERHCMRSFYGGLISKDDVEAYYRIFDTLLADGMPKIYFNFKQHQISPASYLPDWLIPLFMDHLPFEACARLWDVLLLEGDSFLYRAALAMLGVLEPRLFFPDRRELLELLKGENKAALEVARRDGRPPDGAKYEIYGVDEETLWERIDSMEEWWKESTWTRLIQRELPDL